MTATVHKLSATPRGRTVADNDSGARPGQECALCRGRFWIQGDRLQTWRGRDNRLYCSREHADFGIERVQQVLAALPRRVA